MTDKTQPGVPQPVPPATPQAPTPSPTAEPLTPTDLARIDEIKAGTDLGDPQLIVAYGLPAQSRIAGFADSLLGDVRNKDAGAAGAALTDLLKRVRELDVDALAAGSKKGKLPIIGRFADTFGRFATRYGFEIVGTIFANRTGEGSPSARQLAELVGSIRGAGAPALFLETGSNPDLAEQVAAETGLEVVTDLYTHSLGENAGTYLEMMRWNVTQIVEALR